MMTAIDQAWNTAAERTGLYREGRFCAHGLNPTISDVNLSIVALACSRLPW